MFVCFLLGLAFSLAGDVETGVQHDHPTEKIEAGRILDRLRAARGGEQTPASEEPTPAAIEEVTDVDAPPSVIEIEIEPVDGVDEVGCRASRDFWYPGKNLDKAANVVVKNASRGFDFLWLMAFAFISIPVLLFLGLVVLIFKKVGG